MKLLRKHLRAALLAAVIVLGTVLAAGSGAVRAGDPPAGPVPSGAASETACPAPNGTIYNTVQHFLYHVAGRDPYSFYATIPCTGELRECIGYMLDAYQSQGVDLISYFNLHPSASYPYANVRHFCSQMDSMLAPGDTVEVPCGSGTISFLYQKYDTADAAYDAGAFDVAGTMGLVTSPDETYGHCWISLGRFDRSVSETDMRLWLESYYALGDGALNGMIATNDAPMVWKAYADYTVWRVHGARWSETSHGGCIVDNARASASLAQAPCYVLIPTSDSAPTIAQGNLEIRLSSALPGLTAGNPCYALSGAVLGIYTDAACTKQLATAVTDAEGKATVYHLAAQTVYVKLKNAPYGYEAGGVSSAAVPDSGTVSLSVPLTPSLIRTQISVTPQASSASLAGAVFTVRYYACTEAQYISDAVLKGVWTMTAGADGVSFGTDAAVIQAPEGTDGFYRDGNGAAVFPLGFLAVEQTQAAEGQTLGGTWTVSSSAGSGTAPAAGTSSASGSNAPVIFFTASCRTLQSAVSDTTTAFIVTFSPSGDIPDSMQPQYKITGSRHVTGLWFGTNTAQFTERLGLSAMMSCTLLNADGSAKAAGSLMKTGDTVKVFDRSGALYFEGTVLIYGDINGDGLLRMSDLIKVRNHILNTNPLQGIFLEAADCNHDGYIRMSDLIKIRNQVLGTGTIVQTAP